MADHSTALDVPAATSVAGSRLRVAEVAGCLVAAAGGADRRAAAMARRLPAEDDRVAVLMAGSEFPPIPELADALGRWVPGRWESVRLVVPHTGYVGPGWSPAAELADRLGVEVVAPDGLVVAVPEGSLFIVGGQGGPDSGWWRFRPGREPEPTGRRFPAPEWERELADLPGVPGMVVEEVPAGLWLRRPGAAPLTDLAYAMPVHHTTPALLVSRAGEPPVRPADLRMLIDGLPVALRNRLAVVPYGDRLVADARLGAVASLAANRALRVRTGLPLRMVDGEVAEIAALGPDGTPTWRPFVREQAWGPTGAARVLSWAPPAAQLLTVGPAQLALNESWLVEVVESGLWIREIDRLEGSATVRDLPLDSAHCSVVVGVFDDEQGQPPWRAISRLLRRIPSDARARLRLAVPAAAGDHLLRAAIKVSARALDNCPVGHLDLNGRFRLLAAATPPAIPDAASDAAPDAVPLAVPVAAGLTEPAAAPDAIPAGVSEIAPDSVPDAVSADADSAPDSVPATAAEALPAPPAKKTEPPVGLPGLAPVVLVPDHVVNGPPTPVDESAGGAIRSEQDREEVGNA